MEVVVIDGIKFLTSDDSITKDYNTGEWIIKKRADYSYPKTISLNRDRGFLGIVECVYSYTEIANIIAVRTASSGLVWIVRDYVIVGNGRLYPSIVEGSVLLDDVVNLRENNPIKFRAFNCMVRPFKDYGNENLSSEEKRLLYDRDVLFGIRSMSNKAFEGLNYTFGVELETASGKLSEEDCDGLNLKCEFDGSLRETPDQRREDVLGGEYITGVLTGDAGLNQLHRICNKLSEKCSINSKCGVHVHIGSVKFSKPNIVFMYILGTILQDEILSLLPLSRRKNSYCRKITDLKLDIKQLNSVKTGLMYRLLIDEYYYIIHKEVSGGKLPDRKCNKKTNHPQGSKCGYNKEAQRYCWLNFVTAMFNTKGSADAMTLEFRPHHATLNYTKVKNWLKICIAFVNFAENHQDSIKRGYYLTKEGERLPICLSTIVKVAYPKNYCLLDQYISDRVKYFLDDDGKIEETEYSTDKEGIKKLTFKESVCA